MASVMGTAKESGMMLCGSLGRSLGSNVWMFEQRAEGCTGIN